AMAVLRLIGAVHAIAVELSRRHVVEIAVPDVLATFGQLDALEFAATLAVEQAQLDLGGVGGKQGKIGPPAVPACTEARIGSGGQAHVLVFGYQEYRCQRRDSETELGHELV